MTRPYPSFHQFRARHPQDQTVYVLERGKVIDRDFQWNTLWVYSHLNPQ